MRRVSEISKAPANILAAVGTQGLLLAFSLVLAICLNFMQTAGHDRQRVVELVWLTASCCVLAYQSPTLWARTGTRVRRSLTIFFALGVISAAFAFSPRHSLFEVVSVFLLLLSGLAIADALARNPGSHFRLLQAFGGVAALYALKIASVYVSVWLLTAVPDSGDFTPGFSNIRHFNHVQTIASPLLVLLYVMTPTASRLRRLWLAVLAVWWTVLFATGGRGTEVGLIAAAFVTAAVRRRAAWGLLRAMILSAIIGAIVYEVGFVFAPMMAGRLPFGEAGAVFGRTMADPSSGRTLLWTFAIKLIEAHPWLGVGPLHFAHDGVVVQLGAHPHDWVFQIASEWGLPALLALCVSLVFAFRGLWRAGARIAVSDTLNQNMFSAWVLTGAAVLIDGLVSGSTVMPQSQLMIVLYIACATGWVWSFAAHKLPESKAASVVGRIVPIAAAFALAYSVAPQFIDKATDAEPTAAELAINGTTTWWPRLWRDGFF